MSLLLSLSLVFSHSTWVFLFDFWHQALLKQLIPCSHTEVIPLNQFLEPHSTSPLISSNNDVVLRKSPIWQGLPSEELTVSTEQSTTTYIILSTRISAKLSAAQP